jgi:divalent metal cation (Fe/Co/Zn/Cd) transporter
VTAIVLAAFLAVAAVRFIWESIGELTDRAPASAVVAKIEETISGTPGVMGLHELRIRTMGGAVALDVHVLVDPECSVVHGHDIATDVQQRVRACGCNVIEAIVHVEPHEE